MNYLEEKLHQREIEGNLRLLQVHTLPIDFFSNDYLGLSRNKLLLENICTEEQMIGDTHRWNGSTGSRLLAGNNKYMEETETFLSGIFQSEKTLIFNSGYNANLSILSAVPQKGDTILYDELIHASLRDGARLSFAKRFPFHHNNLNDLENKLKRAQGNKFVVVESVYSMDGDFCPLSELVRLCKRYDAHLIVDEAHATGIWGEAGSGLCCHLGLAQEVFARVFTFGKAAGVHGACICGSATLISFLINFARPFIYTTAPGMHHFASIRASFQFIKENPELVTGLIKRINYFKEAIQKKLPEAKNTLKESSSAIQVWLVPGNEKAKAIASRLQKKDMDIRPILSPTVKQGEERLRICIHTFNTENEIDQLVALLCDEGV